VKVEPWVEHWSRKYNGKLYVITASTNALALGRWSAADDRDAPKEGGRARVTSGEDELRDESNAYGIGAEPQRGPTVHGVQYLPDARAWPKGTKLVQWVYLDAKTLPKDLVVLVKADGRWVHAASWGKFDPSPLRKDPKLAYWFLNTFYRHAKGFLGWDTKLLDKALAYIPEKTADQGTLPEAGKWVKLEIPLEKIGATDKLLDGVAFLHEGGVVKWGRTTLTGPDGTRSEVLERSFWGGRVGDVLSDVKIHIAGLKAGTKVRVLFEDRELTAENGSFTDKVAGQDLFWRFHALGTSLYQRFGNGAYGYAGQDIAPADVALHLYEIVMP
jgi:hypothetical protein